MRVSTPRLSKGPKPTPPAVIAAAVVPDAPPEPVERVSPPNAEDREPIATDNPRHVVLVCEDRDEIPRRVTVPNPGDHSVRVDGVIYHHTHEAQDGKWVYTRLRPA